MGDGDRGSLCASHGTVGHAVAPPIGPGEHGRISPSRGRDTLTAGKDGRRTRPLLGAL